MENLKFLNRIVIFTIGMLLFTGCGEIEPMLELQLKEQAVGEVFTFADYCEETYDSIYIIQPYDDGDVICSLPYKMSSRLRGRCSYTDDDTHVSILFIENGVVKAFKEIGNWSAYFSTSNIQKSGHKYHFNQKFIMDERRFVYIYNE